MLADTADSHKLPGKVDEPASKAEAYLTDEKRQKRLAKNRVTARISRCVLCACESAIRFYLPQLWRGLISVQTELACLQGEKTSISAATTAEVTLSRARE